MRAFSSYLVSAAGLGLRLDSNGDFYQGAGVTYAKNDGNEITGALVVTVMNILLNTQTQNDISGNKINDPIGGRSEGLSFNIAAGGGLNIEFGNVYDRMGNRKWYFTIGPSVGADLSIGYISKAHQRVDGKNFNVNDINAVLNNYLIEFKT